MMRNFIIPYQQISYHIGYNISLARNGLIAAIILVTFLWSAFIVWKLLNS